jgi:hypothetical protein
MNEKEVEKWKKSYRKSDTQGILLHMKLPLSDEAYKAASSVLLERGIEDIPPQKPPAFAKGELIPSLMLGISGLFLLIGVLYMFGFSLSKDRGYETSMAVLFYILGFVMYGITKFYAKKKGFEINFRKFKITKRP